MPNPRMSMTLTKNRARSRLFAFTTSRSFALTVSRQFYSMIRDEAAEIPGARLGWDVVERATDDEIRDARVIPTAPHTLSGAQDHQLHGGHEPHSIASGLDFKDTGHRVRLRAVRRLQLQGRAVGRIAPRRREHLREP